MVDFIYNGETNVCSGNIDAFLALAEELQIKRLTVNDDKEHFDSDFDIREYGCQQFQTENKRQNEHYEVEVGMTKYAAAPAAAIENKMRKQKEKKMRNREKKPTRETAAADLYNKGNFTDFKSVDDKLKSLMQKSQNQAKRALLGWERTTKKGERGARRAYMCTVCGKEGENTEIQNHIESNHLEGVSIPCNLCEKSYRKQNGFKHHVCNNKFVRSGQEADETTHVWF